MFEGQLLIKSSTAVYSPWMPRQGDYIRATVDLIARKGTTGSLKVQLFTKNHEDPGNGTDVDSTTPTEISAGSVGQSSATWTPTTGIGLEELVRYRFETDSLGTDEWVVFRMLAPVWWDAVEA